MRAFVSVWVMIFLLSSCASKEIYSIVADPNVTADSAPKTEENCELDRSASPHIITCYGDYSFVSMQPVSRLVSAYRYEDELAFLVTIGIDGIGPIKLSPEDFELKSSSDTTLVGLTYSEWVEETNAKKRSTFGADALAAVTALNQGLGGYSSSPQTATSNYNQSNIMRQLAEEKNAEIAGKVGAAYQRYLRRETNVLTGTAMKEKIISFGYKAPVKMLDSSEFFQISVPIGPDKHDIPFNVSRLK